MHNEWLWIIPLVMIPYFLLVVFVAFLVGTFGPLCEALLKRRREMKEMEDNA